MLYFWLNAVVAQEPSGVDPIYEYCRDSTSIVVGTVRSISVRQGPLFPITDYSVHVEETLKGDVFETVVFGIPSPTARMSLTPPIPPEVGDRILAALAGSSMLPENHFALQSWSNLAMIRETADGTVVDAHGGLVGRNPNGGIFPIMHPPLQFIQVNEGFVAEPIPGAPDGASIPDAPEYLSFDTMGTMMSTLIASEARFDEVREAYVGRLRQAVP